MKLFILTALVAVATAGRLESTYLPPSSAKTAGGIGSFLETPLPQGEHGGLNPSSFGAAPTSFGASSANFGNVPAPVPQYGAPIGPQSYSTGNHGGRQIAILRLNNENNGDGSYHFEYETENKISQQETGQPKHVGNEEPTVVQGSYSYISPEGQHITVNYIADENGFQAAGDHLPTPPPIPEAILKSIELNAAAEAAGRNAPNAGYSYENGVPTGNSGFGGINKHYLAPNKPNFNQQGGYKY